MLEHVTQTSGPIFEWDMWDTGDKPDRVSDSDIPGSIPSDNKVGYRQQAIESELDTVERYPIEYWLDQLRGATTQTKVLAIVEEFRLKGGWTDEQSATMSRCYVPILERYCEVLR
jgi:hypothetical protein